MPPKKTPAPAESKENPKRQKIERSEGDQGDFVSQLHITLVSSYNRNVHISFNSFLDSNIGRLHKASILAGQGELYNVGMSPDLYVVPAEYNNLVIRSNKGDVVKCRFENNVEMTENQFQLFKLMSYMGFNHYSEAIKMSAGSYLLLRDHNHDVDNVYLPTGKVKSLRDELCVDLVKECVRMFKLFDKTNGDIIKVICCSIRTLLNRAYDNGKQAGWMKPAIDTFKSIKEKSDFLTTTSDIMFVGAVLSAFCSLATADLTPRQIFAAATHFTLYEAASMIAGTQKVHLPFTPDAKTSFFQSDGEPVISKKLTDCNLEDLVVLTDKSAGANQLFHFADRQVFIVPPGTTEVYTRQNKVLVLATKASIDKVDIFLEWRRRVATEKVVVAKASAKAELTDQNKMNEGSALSPLVFMDDIEM